MRLNWQQPLALILGVILLGQFGFLFFTRGLDVGAAGPAAEGFGSPHQIGIILFTEYLLPFEITGILLLVAMIGAIVITQKERPGAPKGCQWEGIARQQAPGDDQPIPPGEPAVQDDEAEAALERNTTAR
jgi:hypothetical protein